MPPPPLPASSSKKSTRPLVIVLAVLAGVVVVFGSMLAAILIPTVQRVRETARRTADASTVRQVLQASLIYANDHDGALPGSNGDLNSIQDVAITLAREGGLNDASMWSTAGTNGVTSQPLWNPSTQTINPAFASQTVFAWDYATGLTTAMPASTPVAWTRGLGADGTWAADSAYGPDGGLIAFLSGSVQFFRDLKSTPLARAADGKPTSNILEALPPSARIVGAGPRTLDGNRGSDR